MDASVSRAGLARDEALKALARIRQGYPVSDAIQQAKGLPARDRALMATLVYGVLRHLRYLDAWMKPFVRGDLEPEVQDILRMAFYQMGFLDRVPDYAAVNAAVEQTRARAPRAVGMVNAILRRGQSKKPEQLSLGERYSHPDWIVERWQARYGPRLESILEANNAVPPLTLRVDLDRTSRAEVLEELGNLGIDAEPSPYLPEAIRVRGSLWLEDFEPFRRGWVTVQDESGMLVAWVLDAQPGDEVLDMAAGLGGKALHVLERSGGAVRLTCLDISRPRLRRLEENLSRTGRGDQAAIKEANAVQFGNSHQGSFERIILDAPCSGLGVLRRRVDARWKKQANDLPAFHETQVELLDAAWRACRAGGVIVYSTCSTEPEETEAVVDEVLARRPDLRREDVTPYLPHPDLASFVKNGALSLTPGDLGMDGFYIARLRVKKEAVQ
ncbi:16S rRNA (cytosine(967)-C(5))-methyltransferase RsmB [Sulfobacillus harzensis]|uniref:16S rRNA (cytosine(967)-C(5))-methyltransferase n=1 Tax=Sulfobacillus harzensis TaxID=2729629 RepID=A0A7Y0L5R5_9FIRM|nr:16S rRNA (cytosine(967)-C(5))-methyltransferase RsmB [Sulfobacillus harzensis]NMP22404.1 16S rRNA (cytosine(967)-C(5))-methyltransferase RsmB [Sulfobacillus harzensis]